MKYNRLGNTGIEVSRIALGCWALVGDLTWGEQEEKESLDTVTAARDCGINLFDTAPGYGKGASEELLGRALKGFRQEAVIATKVPAKALRGDDLIRSCEESLRRLQTDCIDLYQVHWPSREVPIEETASALDALREQGKIRAWGVCNFGIQDLTALLARGGCASNQLAYSLLARAIEFAVQPKCAEEGVGILCYSPLAQGLLAGKFRSAGEVPGGRARTRHFSRSRLHTRHGESGCESETFTAIDAIRTVAERIGESMEQVALAWLLERSAVTSVLAGARNPGQVRRNAAAAALRLSSDTIAELDNITEPVKQCLGKNPDLWMSGENSRMR